MLHISESKLHVDKIILDSLFIVSGFELERGDRNVHEGGRYGMIYNVRHADKKKKGHRSR